MALANLVVNMIAKTSAFDKAMNRSSRTVKSMTSDIANSTRSIVRFGRGLLVAAGIGGLGYMLKQSMETIDATAKLSDRIGIATEDLVSLQHAAKIYGQSQETMNKALETFTRRIGEVRMGTGEAKKAMDILGMSADQMAGRSVIDNIKLVADRIQRLETSADKAAAAYYLFGRQGVSMLNLLNQGSQGIAAMQQEAERLGLTFSRLDAARVEAANDAFTRMRGAVTGLVQTLAINAAPMIEALADRMTELLTNGTDVTERLASGFKIVAKAIAFVADAAARFVGILTGLVSGGVGIAALIAKATGQDELAAELKMARDELKARADAAIFRGESYASKIDALFADLEKSAAARVATSGRSTGMAGDGITTADVINKQVSALKGITTGINKNLQTMQVMEELQTKNKELAELQLAAEEAFGYRSEQAARLVENYAKKLELINAYEERQKLLDDLKQQRETQTTRSRGEPGFANPRDFYNQLALAINRQADTMQKQQIAEQKRTTDAIERVDMTINRLLPYAGTVGP